MSLQSVFHMYKINPDLLSVGILHFSYLFVEVTCAVSALASVQYLTCIGFERSIVLRLPKTMFP